MFLDITGYSVKLNEIETNDSELHEENLHLSI